MIPILSSSESYQLDKYVSNNTQQSVDDLIRKSGQSISEFFINNIKYIYRKKILIISGKGNNGLDGIALHHFLQKYGIQSKLIVLSITDRVNDFITDCKFGTSSYSENLDDVIIESYDIVVDAILGTGISREVEGIYKKAIKLINKHKMVISIDIPSGINSDNGIAYNYNVNANLTLAIAYPKVGFFFNQGKKSIGNDRTKTAVFISGAGSNLKNLIKFSFKKNSPISIKLILSNKRNAKGLKYGGKKKIEKKKFDFIRQKKREKKILA